MTIMPAKVYKMSKEGREKKRKWVKLIQDYIHPTTIVLLIVPERSQFQSIEGP